MRILFVCTGNTCRSSMAEALARKWLGLNAPNRRDIELISAGLAAYPGSPASPQAIEVMGMAEIDLTAHQARQMSAELARDSDIIFTMTANQKRVLTEMYPETAVKVFTLAEFGNNRGYDITDPIGQPVQVYQKCARELQELVNRALHKILKQN